MFGYPNTPLNVRQKWINQSDFLFGRLSALLAYDHGLSSSSISDLPLQVLSQQGKFQLGNRAVYYTTNILTAHTLVPVNRVLLAQPRTFPYRYRDMSLLSARWCARDLDRKFLE